MDLGDLEEIWQAEPAAVPIPEPFEVDEDADAPLQPESEPGERETTPVEAPA